MILPMVLVAALATYKVAYLIVWESGPFDLIERFRKLFGVVTLHNAELDVHYTHLERENVITKLLTCPYCMSGWVALLVAFMVFTTSDVGVFIVLWYAVWGGAVLLLRIHETLEQILSM